MSYRELEETVKGLPWVLEEQVLGYARSVDEALPEIFREAGRAFDRALADQVVFLAGLRKLHSIVAGNYWTLNKSGKLLETLDVSKIRAGSLDLSRGGELHARLGSLVKSLENALEKNDVSQYLRVDYQTIVAMLSRDERP
jgi:hypothetical protein